MGDTSCGTGSFCRCEAPRGARSAPAALAPALEAVNASRGRRPTPPSAPRGGQRSLAPSAGSKRGTRLWPGRARLAPLCPPRGSNGCLTLRVAGMGSRKGARGREGRGKRRRSCGPSCARRSASSSTRRRRTERRAPRNGAMLRPTRFGRSALRRRARARLLRLGPREPSGRPRPPKLMGRAPRRRRRRLARSGRRWPRCGRARRLLLRRARASLPEFARRSAAALARRVLLVRRALMSPSRSSCGVAPRPRLF
mmetsp:Transcript_18052/g.47985  ORF Transcript_18052/g.47985 Transcript_18052/m.47985 type:complete len:254 (+) Transcript_18052:1411-2172(+)